jgi:hypothetical protein
MKRLIFFATTAFLLICSPTPAFSDHSTVQFERVFKSQSLSGTIQISATNNLLNGVLVEEMTPNWKTVISSTKTEEKGHFSIPSKAGKNIHYLRLSFYGCHTTYVRVRITRWTRIKKLTFFMQNE